MRNVLIVEDHDDTRKWWLSQLPQLFNEVAISEAETLGQARKILGESHFWLAMIDINLPDGSGIDLISEISIKTPDTLCVVCTIFDDDHHVFSALRAGAQGYLVKDQPRSRQLDQLKEILHGQPPLSPGVARRLLRFFTEELPAGQQELTTFQQDHAKSGLSERETEVLRLIAKGYSRPEVAQLLGISHNTVSTHTKNIYQKLDVSRRAEAVVEAVKLGLIDPDLL